MSERKIRKLKERIAKELAKQDYDDALEAALELRELDPEDDRTLLKVGELHQRLGQEKEALAAYQQLAEFYSNDGRLVRAISVLKMILELDPGDTATAKKLALLYSARGLPPSKAVQAAVAEVDHAADHAEEAVAAAMEEPAAPAAPAPTPAAADAVPVRAPAAPAPSAPAPAATAPSAPAPAAPAPAAGQSLKQVVSDDSEWAAVAARGRTILEELADAEDPFATTAEEEARRQLAADDLQDLDLGDLDLAFVEIAPEAAPEIPHTPLFSDLAPDELHSLLARVEVRHFGPGETIVREGEEGSSVFVVSDGILEVHKDRGPGQPTEVARLTEGAFFGEFGMFTDGMRHATVRAGEEPVEVLEIHHGDLVEIANRHPRVRRVLVQFYRRRALENALAASRIFGHLPAGERVRLAEMCSEERHLAGSTVLQEGDDGEGLYLVKRGQLSVQSQGLKEEPVVLATLGPGDFFGEISVLSKTPVTADVVTLEPTEVLKLSKGEVMEVCSAHPEIREALQSAGQQRLHESIDRLTDAGLV